VRGRGSGFKQVPPPVIDFTFKDLKDFKRKKPDKAIGVEWGAGGVGAERKKEIIKKKDYENIRKK
jgi:hypothetical protein